MFRHGSPPSAPLEGTCPGKLVTPTTWSLTDPLLRAVALVEVRPGEYLGKVLLRRRSGWRLVGYFSLRSP